MTNYENRREEIEPITRMGIQVAIERDTNKICICSIIRCKNCLFYDDTKSCDEVALAWADAEYIEPSVVWSKVTVGTPIWVRGSNDRNWVKRRFAKYQNERVYAFNDDESWVFLNYIISWDYAKLAEVNDGY